MNKSLLAAFAITVVFAGSPLTHQAQAGTGIQRCQGPDGATVYTDKACAALGARTVPMSGELLTKILHEDSRAEADVLAGAMESSIDFAGFADAATPLVSTTGAVGRRSVSGGCARTPTQLAMDLQGAFALGDVNRIAESYHWVGMSHKGGIRIMERLESLSRKNITDTQFFDAQISSGDGLVASNGAASIGGSAGVLQVTFGDDGRTLAVTDFDVERHAGCYFIRY